MAKTDRLVLARHGEREVSGGFTVTDDAKLRFRVTDVDGIPSDDQPEALISVLHDLPPTVSLSPGAGLDSPRSITSSPRR